MRKPKNAVVRYAGGIEWAVWMMADHAMICGPDGKSARLEIDAVTEALTPNAAPQSVDSYCASIADPQAHQSNAGKNKTKPK